MGILAKAYCHFIRGIHQFPLPPGNPDETNVDVNKLACRTCGKDFLVCIAEMNDTTREQALRLFTSPILHPPKIEKNPDVLIPTTSAALPIDVAVAGLTSGVLAKKKPKPKRLW